MLPATERSASVEATRTGVLAGLAEAAGLGAGLGTGFGAGLALLAAFGLPFAFAGLAFAALSRRAAAVRCVLGRRRGGGSLRGALRAPRATYRTPQTPISPDLTR